MTDVSAGFRPPCWCPSRWAPAWRLHTNLYKVGENVSPHIFHKKNYCDLNLGETPCISTFFLFPDSGLNLLNGFDFFNLIYFEWRDTENQQFQTSWYCRAELNRLKRDSTVTFESFPDKFGESTWQGRPCHVALRQ